MNLQKKPVFFVQKEESGILAQNFLALMGVVAYTVFVESHSDGRGYPVPGSDAGMRFVCPGHVEWFIDVQKSCIAGEKVKTDVPGSNRKSHAGRK